MKTQLMNETLSSGEAMDLLTKIYTQKVKNQEEKISTASTEEDIKARESIIKRLQHELAEFRLKAQDSAPLTLRIQLEVNA